MLGPIRDLARTLLAFAETRARLAATEVEEQATRLSEILLWVAAAIFFAGGALMFISVTIVLLFWDANRLLAAGLLAGAYAAAAGVAFLVARSRIRERPPFLGATIAELEKDRKRIGLP